MIMEMGNKRVCSSIRVQAVHDLSPEVVLLHKVLLKTDPLLNQESRVTVPGASKENVSSVYTNE